MELVKKDDQYAKLPSLASAVSDYCQCFRLKDTNHMAICEAIMLAVDNCEFMYWCACVMNTECGICLHLCFATSALLNKSQLRNVCLCSYSTSSGFHGK